MRHVALLLLVVINCLSACRSVDAQVQVPEGFTNLFNGQDLTGWHALPHFDPRKLAEMSEEERIAKLAGHKAEIAKNWSVDNGDIVNDGHGPYLRSDKAYGDIELLIDYKTVALADSGVYLRDTPQVQIWDTTEAGGKWDRNADKGSGGLFNNSKGSPGQLPLVNADAAFGEWNHFRILQVGARTSVWLNDKLVVDHAVMENYWDRERPLFPTGHILLQTHGGEIRWKNLFLREIGADEANTILAAHDDGGFESLFNGNDLDGWAGEVDNYEVRDGAIVCKPGKGGVLFTKDVYSDFVVRLQFRLPPGGNNGLAIRYPGSGNTAYVGMCELQVLDSEHPKYANLDVRQYHGSAYGMAAAHRGYLHPAGAWNFQQTTVAGSTIQVELNGTPILNTDLSTITDFMANSPHPGKDRTYGHFGFAGHSDPVEFRSISIHPLESGSVAPARAGVSQ